MADPISSIPGISSGIDWQSVVDATIAAEKKPITRLQSTLTANSKKKDALELFRQAVGALKTAADGLRKGAALDAYTVAAVGADGAGRSVLAATVGVGAVAGTYAVNVTSLATAQKSIAATGWTSAQTLSADATLDLGGTGKTVDLAAGDSLAAIRDKINLQTAKTGIQASIMSMNAAGTDQRLVLTGQKTGVTNSFPVADGSGGALVAELGFDGTNAVDAGDARFTLDGGATVITRPTNLVTDAIPGATLTLTAKGTSTVTIDRRATAGAEAVQAFVDAYNKVQSFAKSQSVSGAALQNDAFVRSVRGALGTMTLTAAARTDDSGDPTAVAADLTTLSALGVSVQKDGTLAFDQTKFNAVYPSRMNDVRAVFADRMGAFFSYADGINGTYSGQIDQRERAMDDQNATIQARVDDLTARLDKKRSALLAQYAKFEASLARIKSVGDSLTAQFTAMNNSNSNN
jgi:flagellar hook-associated protein 2